MKKLQQTIKGAKFILNKQFNFPPSSIITRSRASSLENKFQLMIIQREYYHNRSYHTTPTLNAMTQEGKISLEFSNGLISKKQLEELIDSLETPSGDEVKFTLLDVRSQQETIGYHPLLPTAVNIPIYHLEEVFDMDDEDFKSQLGIEKPKSSELIIVYCEHGIRSAMAQQVLIEEFGYSNVVNYRGSAHDWYT